MATAPMVEASSVDTCQLDGALQRSYSAVPEAVPVARAAVARFAAEVGVSPALLDDIRLAVSEALTNVVVHAYRESGAPHQLDVMAIKAADEIWVQVSDSGRGVQPRNDSPGLGLGLALMMQLTTGLDVTERALGGTEVRLRFQL